MEKDCCVHKENVDIVLQNLPSEDDIADVAEIFHILGDPTRIRILEAIRTKELCVGDIAALMEISQSGVSHQLRLMKKSRIIKGKREGKLIFYSLNDEHISQLMDIALTHIHES